MSASPQLATEEKEARQPRLKFSFSAATTATAATEHSDAAGSRLPGCSPLPSLLTSRLFSKMSLTSDKKSKDSGITEEQLEDSPKELPIEERHITASRTLRNIMSVAAVFFKDKTSRCMAISLTVVLCAIMGVDVCALVFIADVFKDLNNSLMLKDEEAFYENVHKIIYFVIFLWIMTSFKEWMQGSFALEWRRSITRNLFTGYIGESQAFYHLKAYGQEIDNPDQRIGQDVAEFTESAVSFIGTMGSAFLTLCVMSGLLIRISTDLFLYLGLGSAVTTVLFLKLFGGRLMHVQRRVLSQEATLRFALMRVRENAESIAFYQGAPFELLRVSEIFAETMRAMYKRLTVFVAFLGTQKVVFMVAQAIPTLVIGPKFLRGEVTFGDIGKTHMLFTMLMASMTQLVAQLGTLTNMGAQATRVQQLRKALEEIEHEQTKKASAQAGDADSDYEQGRLEETLVHQELEVTEQQQVCLQLSAVTLWVPNSEMSLISNLTFTLRRGESVLVCGESGVGKSSLLRAIAGLWDTGSGTLSRCAFRRSIFLPQESYMCLGSLRENATYPSMPAELEGLTDDDVLRVLEAVNLAYLPERYGLDARVDFDRMLSGGEKQRLGFARLLLRPKPLEFAILDEATSALDETNERRMYTLLQDHAYVHTSVGHRPQLRSFHTHSLLLERLPAGGTSATFQPVPAAAESRKAAEPETSWQV